MNRRTHPCIAECPFCGSDKFRAEGTILLDVYASPEEKRETLWWKYWCDRCERGTLIEVRGCAVPVPDFPGEVAEGAYDE